MRENRYVGDTHRIRLQWSQRLQIRNHWRKFATAEHGRGYSGYKFEIVKDFGSGIGFRVSAVWNPGGRGSPRMNFFNPELNQNPRQRQKAKQPPSGKGKASRQPLEKSSGGTPAPPDSRTAELAWWVVRFLAVGCWLLALRRLRPGGAGPAVWLSASPFPEGGCSAVGSKKFRVTELI